MFLLSLALPYFLHFLFLSLLFDASLIWFAFLFLLGLTIPGALSPDIAGVPFYADVPAIACDLVVIFALPLLSMSLFLLHPYGHCIFWGHC
jgi:hypothetical protein